MHVTSGPMQFLSRVIAICVIALPLAGLRMAVDDYERQAIVKMSHQELIDFVKQIHASSFLNAYFLAAITTIILVAAIEAVALAIRWGVGWFTANQGARRTELYGGVELGEYGTRGVMHPREH
jgi:phosphotransferase system  glucose/maltose/N-acetylglucosamine-specific IIC component